MALLINCVISPVSLIVGGATGELLRRAVSIAPVHRCPQAKTTGRHPLYEDANDADCLRSNRHALDRMSLRTRRGQSVDSDQRRLHIRVGTLKGDVIRH